MKIYENIYNIDTVEQLGYDCKRNNKKNLQPFHYLTKKGFKDLCYDCNGQIKVVGDVFINQRYYEDIESAPHPEKVESKKEQKDIIGIATILYSNSHILKNKEGEEFKKYDLYQHNKYLRYCIGYAQVDEGKFVRLVRHNPIPLLLILLLALLFAFMFKSCPNYNPITINQGNGITAPSYPDKSAELCYYTPFAEQTVLTKDNPCVSLENVSTNEDEYYISFSIYINGEAMKNEKGEIFSTGAIPPNRQVDINLFNELDEGVYELKAIATDYDFNIINDLVNNEEKYSEKEKAELLAKAVMPVKHTLSTTLIVRK